MAAPLTHSPTGRFTFPTLRSSTHFSFAIWLCRPTELSGSPWTSDFSSVKLGGWPRFSSKFLSILIDYGLQFPIYDFQLGGSATPPPPFSQSARPWMCLCAPNLRIPVSTKQKVEAVTGGGGVGWRGWAYVSSREVRGESKGPCGLGVWVWMELQDTSISITTP